MISKGKIDSVREKQKDLCNICKFKLQEGKFHVDHIKPKSKGGDDGGDNLQLICIPCHSKKNEADGVHARYPKYTYTSVCDECGKVVGGYSQDHSNYLMQQHMLKHEREKKNNSKKQEKGKDVF